MRNTLIFDLDGTLLDTPSGIVESFTLTIAELDFPTVAQQEIRNTIGMPLEKAFAQVLNIDVNDALIVKAIELYQKNFRQVILPKAEELMFPNVKETLVKLKEQGKTLAVATSKYHASAVTLLEAAGLLKLFDLVVGADQVSEPKPAPEMGFYVMKQLDTNAEDSIMVGDTTHDLNMAHSAGMASIAVSYGVHSVETLQTTNPNYLIDDFADICTLVNGS